MLPLTFTNILGLFECTLIIVYLINTQGTYIHSFLKKTNDKKVYDAANVIVTRACSLVENKVDVIKFYRGGRRPTAKLPVVSRLYSFKPVKE